jgi:hypothetical protein
MHKIAATHALCIQESMAIFSTPQYSLEHNMDAGDL